MAVRSSMRPTGAEIRAGTLAADCRAMRAPRSSGWRVTYEGLSGLDRRSPLAVDDLELLATAAFLLGSQEESRHALLRAYQIHLSNGDSRRAARCAAKIGLGQISTGELARATGCLPASLTSCSAWVAQAAALLEDQEECAEHGLLLIPEAYERLAMRGDIDGAAGHSERAVGLARRFDDPDLLVLGLMVQGRATARSGRVHDGLELLDEAVREVVIGRVSPPIAGIILTSAVDASEEVFDLRHFEQWTLALSAWCDAQQGMIAFQSRALLHRAMLSRLQGEWNAALEAVVRASKGPSADADALVVGAAHYQEGEIHRLQGNLPEAETAYLEASRRGIDPQPGLALLRLAQGDAGTAVRSTVRAVGESRDPPKRAKLLPASVEILITVGELSAAAEAAVELQEIADGYGTPVVVAMAQHALGAVRLAEGDALGALESLRQACHVWLHFGLPYEQARTRLLIARSCRLLGDEETARLELDAARKILSDLQVRPGLAVHCIRDDLAEIDTHRLTKRELEVLRLLSTGLTNKAIADELVVAVKTVDSHVSSIFTRLGVSSRAAATAYAHRHRLV